MSFADMQQVDQALQTQLDRDFTPIWGVRATILAFDKAHKPFAQVKDTQDWSVTASHEMLEMLVDPYGQRFVKAPDIDPNSDGHWVNYLVEVGDACEIYEYSINGVAVSDFGTPEFYNADASAGTEVDFLSRLCQPYEVPAGCYISWIDPEDGRWHQKQVDGTFVRSARTADPKANPRDDRHEGLGDDDGRRHDVSRIRKEYIPKARKQSTESSSEAAASLAFHAPLGHNEPCLAISRPRA
jgi:hypothetical protein